MLRLFRCCAEACSAARIAILACGRHINGDMGTRQMIVTASPMQERVVTHACTAHETSLHMPHVTSNFIIHPQHPLSGLSGRPTQLVHIIPAFTSSNTLTGRTGPLHIFQTLVPSYRAQVFI